MFPRPQVAIFVLLMSKIQSIQHWIKEFHFFPLTTKDKTVTTHDTFKFVFQSNNLSAHDTLSLCF